MSEANLDLEDWQHPDGVLIYGLGLVEPWFIYDNLRSLSRLDALQRDYWSLMSHGQGVVGHLYFFKLLDFVPCANRELMPYIKGLRSFFTTLPVSQTTYMLEDMAAENALPCWAMDSYPHACVQLPRAFATLLTQGFHKSFSLCELGRSRGELCGQYMYTMGWNDRHPLCVEHLRH